MSKLPEIPGYRIIRKLGQGGMADVFLGMQENLEREVAIKILVPALFRDERFAVRFIKEAQTAARLAHPNIITIHDIGQVGDTYYIVMEHLLESLNARMKKLGGALEPKVALRIVKMTAAALDYAHEKGFIHRDIKPDNIMFRQDGTVVLVDFGIARAINATTQLTRTGMSIGTPHYMSPEQCRGEKIDGRSDIYSLGVQLFELITGTVPYTAENTAGIILKHIQDPIPRLPVHLAEYQLLIEKMMAKDKEMRIQTGAELVKFIDGIMTAQDQHLMPTVPMTKPEITAVEQPTIQTATPTTPISFRKQPKRKKWLLPVLLVFVAGLILGTVYVVTQKPFDKTDAGSPPIDVKKTEGNEKAKDTEAETGKKTLQTPEIVKKTPDPQIEGEADTSNEKESIEKEIKAEPETTEKKAPPAKKDPIKKQDQEPLPEKKPGKKTGEKETGTKEKQEKTTEIPRVEKPKVERQTKKDVSKKDVKPEIVSLLGLHPDLRRAYNRDIARIAIKLPLLAARLKVMGQVVLTLFIDQKGDVSVLSYKDMVSVFPRKQENRVKKIIRARINDINLQPPTDRDGNPVQLGNWRVTYKVGKFLNKIILTKQK